ncbi:MAG: hypothetical protein ACO1TE_22835 [Prosthecobacter sp.]
MKRKILRILAASSVVILILHAVYPPFEKWVEMTRGVCAIRWSSADKPITRHVTYRVTNLDDLTSEDLADHYESAARALLAQSPEAASYRWSDNVLFYSRVSTLLHFPAGYIEVVASCNNDNDAVSIHFSSQPFTEKGRTEMERIDSHAVPASLFRPRHAR